MKVLLVCFLWLSASFSNSYGQAPASSIQPTSGSTLLIQADADCAVTIDGGQSTPLEKDRIVRLQVSPGDHIIVAVSKQTPDAKWQSVVTLTAGQQKALLIPLASVIAKESSSLDKNGKGPGEDGYLCRDNRPGDCAFDIYLHAELGEHPDKKNPPQPALRNKAFQEMLPYVDKGQLSMQHVFDFLFWVSRAMRYEMRVPDQHLTGKKTLFTEKNILAAYVDASGDPYSENKLKNLNIALSNYVDELHANEKSRSVDIDQLWIDAVAKLESTITTMQNKTPLELHNAATRAIQEHGWFDSSVK